MIASAGNARIKEARKLQRRRARYAAGQALLEGVRLVRDAWQAGAALQTVFYAPELLAGNVGAAALVAELTAARVEMIPCATAAFAALTDTVTPQGVVAVVALPALPVPAPRTLTLLLDQVRDPGNAGTLIRSAEAAGVDLVLCGPESVDPFNDKALRAGMGAHFRVPLRVCETWDAVTPWLDAPLLVADAAGTVDYDAIDWRASAILAVGGEAHGPSAAIRARATAIRIPMLGRPESLNAGVAGSVILFEAARQRRMADQSARSGAR
jgi:TrmH family RNA methyltransferase